MSLDSPAFQVSSSFCSRAVCHGGSVSCGPVDPQTVTRAGTRIRPASPSTCASRMPRNYRREAA